MPNQYTWRNPVERFWGKVNKDGPIPTHRPELGQCWVWLGGCSTSGYGRFINQQAHRFAWQLMHGEIHSGLHALHHCDNPPCVRPDHLFLGTRQDNMRDMVEKQRHARQSHPETYPVGSAIKQAVLTENDVKAIRLRRSAGESAILLAREYGIATNTAKRIIRGKGWRHADGPITPGRQAGTGERNIYRETGRSTFRVSVTYRSEAHHISGLKTLPEAVQARDALRAELMQVACP